MKEGVPDPPSDLSDLDVVRWIADHPLFMEGGRGSAWEAPKGSIRYQHFWTEMQVTLHIEGPPCIVTDRHGSSDCGLAVV